MLDSQAEVRLRTAETFFLTLLTCLDDLSVCLDSLQHYIRRIFHSQTALLFCSSLQMMFRLQQTTAENTINKQGWNSQRAAALHYVQLKLSLKTKYGRASVSPPRRPWMNNEMQFYKSTAFLRDFPSAAGEHHADTSLYWCEMYYFGLRVIVEYTNGIIYLHTDWVTGCPCRQVKRALEHRSSNKPQAESILL